MKVRWSVVMLVILGVAAALSAAVFTASMSAQQIKEVVGATSPEVEILVAAADIPAATQVKADMFTVKMVQEDQAAQGSYKESTQIVGKTTAIAMVEGQVFTPAAFPVDGTGAHLAVGLPSGKRAVTIELTSYAGLEGLLYPGSIVDVITSFSVSDSSRVGKAVSTTLLQNITVLAVQNLTVGSNNDTEKKKASRPKASSKRPLVTLLVDSKQAEALQLAVKYGAISLAMRNPTDMAHVETEATLLSEGKLAGLAEFLTPSILPDDGLKTDHEETDEPAAEVQVTEEPVAAPPVAEVAARAKTLSINVYRGVTKIAEPIRNSN